MGPGISQVGGLTETRYGKSDAEVHEVQSLWDILISCPRIINASGVASRSLIAGP